MNQTVHYTNCPVCHSEAIRYVLSARDHTVSQENFEIWECADCSLRFTQDVPGPLAIQPYYKSEKYISHSNSDKGFINQLYQRVRRITLKKKRGLVQKVTGLQKGSLLDLGSGTGAFAHTMKEAGWEVRGLEPDTDARRTAKELHGILLEDSSELYQLPASAFDAITLWHVLEHVHDLHPYLEQLKGLLRENGKLLIAVPNYTSLDAAIYREYWAAYDVPRHLYHFSPASMKLLLEKHGLKLSGKIPMWYDSFYISLLSSRYKNGRANLFAAFMNGLRSNIKAMRDEKRCSSVIYIASLPSEGGF